MNLTWLVPILAELAVPVVGGILSAAATWAASWFARETGLKMEIAKKQAIHDAAARAVEFAIAKLRIEEIDITLPQATDPILRMATPYLTSLVKGYLSELKVSPDAVEKIILSKIPPATRAHAFVARP
jgi:hypothetical protein